MIDGRRSASFGWASAKGAKKGRYFLAAFAAFAFHGAVRLSDAFARSRLWRDHAARR